MTVEAGDSAAEAGARVDPFLATESIMRERRGKAYDMRPLIEQVDVSTTPAGEVRLHMRLSARPSATARPEEVLDQLGIPSDTTRIERTRLIFSDSPVK